MNYYKVLTGMNWTGPDGEDVRAEPGEVRDDVPAVSVAWLLADGHLEVASEPAPAVAPEPVAAVPVTVEEPHWAAPASTFVAPVVTPTPAPWEPTVPAPFEPGVVDVQVPAADVAEVEELVKKDWPAPSPTPDVRGL